MASTIDTNMRALLEWIFVNALDEDSSGFIEEREANRVAKYCGMGGATGDINALWTTMLEMDTDGDERISKEEWVVFMNKSLNGNVAYARELKDRVDAKLNQRDALAQAYTPCGGEGESGLVCRPGDRAGRLLPHRGHGEARDHPRSDGERRQAHGEALGLRDGVWTEGDIKINATWKQTRDDGERWLGKRPQGPDGELVEVEVAFNEVNLYDLDKYVIRPATEEKQCAMVELMASGEQPPDFFVSHWAEPILEFFKCLLEHAWARGFESEEGTTMGRSSSSGERLPHPLYLGGRPPHYWVCAYANNQWTLASELVEDLAETSFARAMRISMGTVSVVDRSAGCFGRIWCVYELSGIRSTARTRGVQVRYCDGEGVGLLWCSRTVPSPSPTACRHGRRTPMMKLEHEEAFPTRADR